MEDEKVSNITYQRFKFMLLVCSINFLNVFAKAKNLINKTMKITA